ncbi:co-chaperone YbbN [Rhodospirillum rubrum]|uniref:thioredoxin family protein n=1 Tax=Rhodospirillum rubrum TaxID=1085 RepID=UPI0019075F0B|nr:co-chaperone YbbN [Rhodospirillum rubrum]MBK1663493.1 co-chaperone YbbN [Rhodospirillum rubrum]MBK1675691.1 co-chaperone YbbN [Rhodospirillum rubrum]
MSLIFDGSGTPIKATTAPKSGSGSGALVKDSDTPRFAADVIEASREVPVIVDFWSPSSPACATLTALLERLVTQRAGAVRLVKINIDSNRELAAQLRLQSVPTIYAFADGRPVDGFMGALPEAEVKAFIDRLTGDAGDVIDEALAQADALRDQGDIESAFDLYQQILEQDQANPRAMAGALRCRLAQGANDEVREVLGRLPPVLAGHAEIVALKSVMDLAEQAEKAGPTAELRARLTADPADHQASIDLAVALFAGGDTEAAMDLLLESIRRDRAWNEEAARKQLLKFWEALGHSHPLTVGGRRKLSSILFS